MVRRPAASNEGGCRRRKARYIAATRAAPNLPECRRLAMSAVQFPPQSPMHPSGARDAQEPEIQTGASCRSNAATSQHSSAIAARERSDGVESFCTLRTIFPSSLPPRACIQLGSLLARSFLSCGGCVGGGVWAAKMRAPGLHNGAPGGETVALATIFALKSCLWVAAARLEHSLAFYLFSFYSLS
eukprot:SAG11_NODE_30_length_23132_cov_22.413277_5_plen_186_part_00